MATSRHCSRSSRTAIRRLRPSTSAISRSTPSAYPGDAQALVRERGVFAARQSAAIEMIRRRAGAPGLDPARVAEQLGMSVRYLHRLLEPTGRTFQEHLLEHRLQYSLARSCATRECRLTISHIARDCGFSDISHFNRSFRRAFSDTPYGVRFRAACRRNG